MKRGIFSVILVIINNMLSVYMFYDINFLPGTYFITFICISSTIGIVLGFRSSDKSLRSLALFGHCLIIFLIIIMPFVITPIIWNSP